MVGQSDAIAAGRPFSDLAVRLYVESDPPLRAWLGVGDFNFPADAIDSGGGIYSGVGELVNLPVLSQLINGTADRVEFVLAGVSAEILDLVDADANQVRYKRCFLGLTALDADGSVASTHLWLWDGRVDAVRVAWDEGEAARVRTIALSVGDAMTGRSRAPLAFYTGPDQRRRSPDDAFCDRSGIYTQGSTVKWPS